MKANSKKLLPLLLCITLVAVLFTATISVSAEGTYGTWEEVADNAVEGTDYTMDADGNMQIHTAAGLAYFAQQVNSRANTFAGKTVVLTEDINLMDAGVTGYNGDVNPDTGELATVTEANSWTAIGAVNTEEQFAGTFDGQGYTVSSVYINGGYPKGLFGTTTSDTVIQNVGVINSHIIGDDRVGGVVGYNNSGTVQNCYNTGTVSGTGNYVGGVVGYNNSGTVQNCYNTGTVSGTGNYVGGVVGYDAMGTVQNCYNTGAVNGASDVGGVVGQGHHGTVQNCYNSGDVSGTGDQIGGVVGYNRLNSIVNDCYFLQETDGINDGLSGIGNDANSGGASDTGASPMTEAEMQAPSFVTETEVEPYGLDYWVSANKSSNPDLSLWVVQSGDFPTLAVFTTTWDKVAAAAQSGTDYTMDADDNMQIHTAAGLAYFAQQVNSGTNLFENATVVLTDNIDLMDAGVTSYGGTGNTMDATVTAANSWSAIGTLGQPFKGTFDGQGHTVSGVYINSGYNNKGLLGYTKGETMIQNVGVIDSHIKGDDVVGGVVGYTEGTVQNCYNTGDVNGADKVGGVVGWGYSSDVYNCYNTGVVSGTDEVGGVIGSSSSIVQNCYFLQGSASKGIGSGFGTADAMTEELMQDSSFVNTLSGWVIDEGNGDLKLWVAQAGDYPTFGDLLVTWKSVADNAVMGKDYTWYDSDNIQIHTAAGLAYFAQQVNIENADIMSVNVVLTDDINLMDAGVTNYSGEYDDSDGFLTLTETNSWPTIGANGATRAFWGTFDGQGHTVSGVYINGGESKGLFGFTADTTVIQNLGVINSHISGTQWLGGIAGRNAGTVQNCYNTGIVNGTEEQYGGIVGYNISGTVQNCYNTGDVSAKIYAGGVIGYNYNGTVQNCYNTGDVSADTFPGGAVGYNQGGTVQNCYFLQETGGINDGLYGIGRDETSDTGNNVGTYPMTSSGMQESYFTENLNNWVLDNKATISGLYHWLQETSTSYPTLKEGYTVTTTNASVDGYIGFVFVGDTVTLSPDNAPTGQTFDSWTVTPSTVVITNNSFTMPNEDVTVTANFKDLLPQSLSFAQNPVKKTVGDGNFTNTLTGAKTAVTYISTNESVAKVNSVTGEVTIVSAGTATIVAIAQADGDYSGSRTAYPLIVDSVKALTFDDITDYIASFDGDFDELAKIYFNGVELKLKQIDADTYEIYGYPAGSSTIIGKAEKGSVVVTLYEEFLRTLPAGDYDLSVTFSGEQVETAAAVVVTIPEGETETEPETETDVPATGDNSNALLWVTTMLLSVGAMTVIIRKRAVK